MKKYAWVGAVLALIVVMTSVAPIYGEPAAGLESEAPDHSKDGAKTLSGEVKAGFERVAENEYLALDFNPETAEIIVTELKSGGIWQSNPEGREEDPVAKGSKKMDLQSQLLLDYVDPQSKPFQLNNYTGSIKDKTFEWSKGKDGIDVTFQFPKAGITIPVRYSLQEDAFSATILTEGILQEDKFRLVNISLLPFFGAGGPEDEGYMFIPDGSGALIHLNNRKSHYKSYNERVFGGDQALTVTGQTAVKQDIKLPVYGLKSNDNAFLAVIHQGAYQAGIAAEVGGKSNQYNNIYSYLNVMESETNLIMEGTLNEKQVLRTSETLIGNIPYEVKYYFLYGEDADYAGMAHRYRQYLMEEQGMGLEKAVSSEHVPLLIDFIGGIKKRKTFLGIPYNSVETLTSYKDVTEAASELQEKGVTNLFIRYEGWMADGLLGKVPTKVKPESNLGGTRGWREMIRDLKDADVAFYPAMDPVHFFKGGNGFNKFSDVTKGISRAPVLQYDYRLSDGAKNPERKPWYLLKPETVLEALGRFTKMAAENDLQGIAVQGIGSMVYSDFRKGSLSKNETGQIWEDSLEQAQSHVGGLMFDHASAYTFPYAEAISDVPLYTSGFDVEDESVPFYSIAISGLIPAFSEPINLSGDPGSYLLKLIETGTYPAYRLIASDGELLEGTPLDSLYSAEFGLWSEELSRQYGVINEALDQVAGKAIMEHEKLDEGVFRTTYDGGTKIIVNYNDEPVQAGGKLVQAKSWLVEQEERS